MDLHRYIGLIRRVWRQLLAPFAVAFITLTALMLLHQIRKQLPSLRALGVPGSTILKVFVLSIPFVVVITLPMAMLIAVLRVLTRPATNRVNPLQMPDATPMRLVLAVLAGATLVGALVFLLSNTVLPRSNSQLHVLQVEIQRPGAAPVNEHASRDDREMSTEQLGEVVRNAEGELRRAEAEGDRARANVARRRAAIYAVEIQKKLALSAACVVFALLGATVGLSIRGGGWPLVVAVSFAVFLLEYIGLTLGEELGDRLVVSPFVAMWSVNLVLGVVALGFLRSMSKSVGVERVVEPPA